MTEINEQAIAIIEKIQKIGFPNKNDVSEMDKLIKELQKLSPKFKHSDQIAIQQAAADIEKFKKMLEKDHDIPTNLYTNFNGQLIMLKTNLRTGNKYD